MSRSFREMPIKQKLVVTMMATTATALLLAAFGIVITDSLLFRGYLRRDLSALARIIADNTTAALSFDDPKSAAETLGSLRARPHVIDACVYRPDGAIFATYSRPDSTGCPPAAPGMGIRFTAKGVIVSQPIMLSGRQIGSLILQYDLGEIWERIRLYGSTVLGVLLASSLVAFLLSSRLREMIAAPISHLVRATTSVSETGDYSTRADKFSNDELGLLVDRFNEMLAGIQSRDDALKKERERFRFMAESMPQKIFTARPDGYTDYLNRQWSEYTHLPLDQMTGSNWAQLIHPDDVEETVAAWKHSVETGEPLRLEHRLRNAAGKYCWHLTSAHAMRDTDSRIIMWIGSSTEIHEQKEKEQALRRANDDLQQFAYSASHDLREPIRNVAVYSEIVANRYQGVLDEEGRMFLGFLTEGGRRLAMLVSDLLAYTSAGTGELTEPKVDSTAVLKHSLSSLAEAIRESGAEVTYDPLPEIYMGEAHLQQVLQNLLSNALKYRDQSPPRIHVSAVRQSADWCFSVKDNGIGIDPQYKEKIFGVFKRLHHDRTYGGTGIGLAICKRVVERYGGRIWVDSEPGKGSTFYFTVPRRAHSRTAKVE